jgi:glycosyltransferase involved in cell wall biosynthesis
MKISIITVAYNSATTISDTIRSVLDQDYSEIEYIIVDGLSKDSTVNIINSFSAAFNGRLKWISEKDKGIYDAMNKGIRMATGDVIGILNSDDYFSGPHVVSYVMQSFQNNTIDAVFGNVLFVKPNNTNKIIRRFSARGFRPWMFRFGFMPPHPSFFTRKKIYNHLGYYNHNFDISGDYELLVRFLLIHKIKYQYINLDMVKMRTGGASTKSLKTILINNNKNVIEACRINGVYTNIFMVSVRYFKKITELVQL